MLQVRYMDPSYQIRSVPASSTDRHAHAHALAHAHAHAHTPPPPLCVAHPLSTDTPLPPPPSLLSCPHSGRVRQLTGTRQPHSLYPPLPFAPSNPPVPFLCLGL